MTPRTGWILTSLVLVAFNLRLALTSVGPVVVDIQAATGWSDTSIGLLTTAPVLVMGLMALSVPRLAHRFGRRRVVSAALLILVAALALRWFALVPGVLLITALAAGVGIALAGGLVPGVVRERVSHRMKLATVLWTAAMMSGAAIGGAITAPLALAWGSWQGALAFWALPALAALVVWQAVDTKHTPNTTQQRAVSLRDLPWRNPVAIALTAFMAFNSVIFYAVIAWIPASYEARGWSQTQSGYLLGLFTLASVASSLTLPTLAHRVGKRRVVFMTTISVATTCLLLIGFVPEFATPVVLIAFGYCLSGGFALSLGLLSEYSSDSAGSARLTAMAFFVAYSVGALGPFLAGAILDLFGSWQIVFLTLAVIAALQLTSVTNLRTGVFADR